MIDPVLHVANKTGHFLLYTDESCKALSAILHQVDEKWEENPIEFAYKTYNVHERRYAPTEGELLAIIFGLYTFLVYLLFIKYIVLGTVSRRTSDSLAQWFNSHIISIFGVP